MTTTTFGTPETEQVQVVHDKTQKEYASILSPTNILNAYVGHNFSLD
jgi:hypothetical protein